MADDDIYQRYRILWPGPGPVLLKTARIIVRGFRCNLCGEPVPPADMILVGSSVYHPRCAP